MSSVKRSGSAWPRLAQLGAVLASLIALAACGSTAAPGAAAAPGSASTSAAARPAAAHTPADLVLCANPAAVTKVVIWRNAFTRGIQPVRQLPPGVATVTTGAPARALARALCALPRMPKGIVNCPMLLPSWYKLQFWIKMRPLPVVRITPTGCETVTGIGPVRRIMPVSKFWQVLARAIVHIEPVHGPVVATP